MRTIATTMSSWLVLAVVMCTMVVVFALAQETTIDGDLGAFDEDISDAVSAPRSLGDYFGSIFPAGANTKHQDDIGSSE